MVKTIIFIPRMFTKKEFKDIARVIPEDFHTTEQSFWEYITEKLDVLIARITWVFSYNKNEDLAILNCLTQKGIKHVVISDRTLLSEVIEWYQMTHKSPNKGVFQLYNDSVQDIQQHILCLIDKTMQDNEIGVLLLYPSIQVSFPDKYRVIRMLPFNPIDYLNRYLTIQKINTS